MFVGIGPFPKLAFKDTVTIYNYYKDDITGNETYMRTVLDNCYWREDSIAQFKSTGVEVPSNVTLRIIYRDNYRNPREWHKIPKSDIHKYFTMELGQRISAYIARGNIDYEFGWLDEVSLDKEFDRFSKEYDPHKVVEINEAFHGTKNMWQLIVRC